MNKVDVYAADQVAAIEQAISDKIERRYPVVLINTGGVREVMVEQVDGSRHREMRPESVNIKPLLEAIEQVVADNPEALHRFRDAGILMLAEEKLNEVEVSGKMLANPTHPDGDKEKTISTYPPHEASVVITPSDIRDVGIHMEAKDDISDATIAGAGKQIPAHRIPHGKKGERRSNQLRININWKIALTLIFGLLLGSRYVEAAPVNTFPGYQPDTNSIDFRPVDQLTGISPN